MYRFSSVGYKTDTEGDYTLYAKAHTIIEIIPSPSFFESHSTLFSPHLPPSSRTSCTEGQGCDGYSRDQTLMQHDLSTNFQVSEEKIPNANLLSYSHPVVLFFFLPTLVKLPEPVSLSTPPMYHLTHPPAFCSHLSSETAFTTTYALFAAKPDRNSQSGQILLRTSSRPFLSYTSCLNPLYPYRLVSHLPYVLPK